MYTLTSKKFQPPGRDSSTPLHALRPTHSLTPLYAASPALFLFAHIKQTVINYIPVNPDAGKILRRPRRQRHHDPPADS